MTIRTILVDDEPLATQGLRLRLEAHDDVEIVATAAMTAALAGGSLIGVTLGNPLASGAQDGTESTTTAPNTAPGTDSEAPGPGRGLGRGHKGGFGLTAAAEALDMTEDELRTALQGGKTLAEVAADQGVEKQALIDKRRDAQTVGLSFLQDPMAL